MDLRLPTPRPVVLLSLSIAASLAVGSAMGAEQASKPVSLSGLDLSTPAGIVAAEARIDLVARSLCRQFEDTRRVSNRATFADCVRDTRVLALRQLEARAPTAFAAAQVRR